MEKGTSHANEDIFLQFWYYRPTDKVILCGSMLKEQSQRKELENWVEVEEILTNTRAGYLEEEGAVVWH